VPLYESDVKTVKSELATFFDVFPQGSIWGNENSGSGYDTVLLGHMGGARVNVEEIEARLQTPAYAHVLSSLNEVGFGNFSELLYTYAGQARQLQPWLKDAQINRDGNLRLQYLAGLALNNSAESMIYDQILGYRRYPSELLVASPEKKQTLERFLGGSGH
jgi:spermidine synthase